MNLVSLKLGEEGERIHTSPIRQWALVNFNFTDQKGVNHILQIAVISIIILILYYMHVACKAVRNVAESKMWPWASVVFLQS